MPQKFVLNIIFGKDQVNIPEVLKSEELKEYLVEYETEERNGDVLYTITFNSPYGPYLFGHLQGRNLLKDLSVMKNSFRSFLSSDN